MTKTSKPLTVNKIEYLTNLFKSPTTGFQSSEKLYKKAKIQDKTITLKNVKEYLSQQSTTQITKQVKRETEFDSVRSRGVKNNYQVDVMFLPDYKQNGNWRYIVSCIDVYSRYAFIKPIKTKTGSTVLTAFKELMKEHGLPVNLNLDLGSEFVYKPFVQYCEENNIKLWYSDKEQDNKNAIIERFHRTLRQMILQYTTENGKGYIEALPDLISNYNTTEHSTIKNKPLDVWEGKSKNHQDYNIVEHLFKVGDLVRHKVSKSEFAKGSSTTNFTKKVYSITTVSGRSYYLDNLTKPFREHELVLAVGKDITSKYDKDNEIDKRQELINRRLRKEGLD